MTELVLGIDLGTSYFKLGLFDVTGTLRGLGRVPVPMTNEGDRCELTPRDFRGCLRDAFLAALRTAGAEARQVRAVGTSSQANTFLLLDADARPLTPLISWCDRRGDPSDERVCSLWNDSRFLERTGLGLPPRRELAVTKLRLLQRTNPEVWSRTRFVATLSDYLSLLLTGRRVCDAGTASLLGLLDVRRCAWWPPALGALGLEPDGLARPVWPGTAIGSVSDDGADLLDLPRGTVLCAGTLDHYAAALGAGLGTIADVSDSTGTVLACIRERPGWHPAPGRCAGPGFAPDRSCSMAFDANGAAVLEWYRRAHAPGCDFAVLDAEAALIPPGCDGLAAVPSAHTHPGLTGFRGADRRHDRGHYVRAIMESVNDTLACLLERLCPDGLPARILATGGGAHSDVWLQMKANRLGTPFVRTTCPEPACAGAALLASQAAGWGSPMQTARRWARIEHTFSPERPSGPPATEKESAP